MMNAYHKLGAHIHLQWNRHTKTRPFNRFDSLACFPLIGATKICPTAHFLERHAGEVVGTVAS